MKKKTAIGKFASCSHRLLLASLVLFLAWPVAVGGQQEASVKIAFHHVHLNTTDPAAASNFYTRTFDVTRKVSVAGMNGVQSENMYLLFNTVAKPAPSAKASAIWHFGWGSPAMEDYYQRHLANGVVFQTPVTRLASGLPMGGDLEFADELTLGRALSGRRAV